MGYYTHYTGRIEIDPPLPWRIVKDSPGLPDFDSDVKLVIEVYEVETDEGLMLRQRAIAVVPAGAGRFKGYDMREDLQAVVDQVAAAGMVATFSGRIDALGEDGDRWRFKVIDGKVRRFTPTLTWPIESD